VHRAESLGRQNEQMLFSSPIPHAGQLFLLNDVVISLANAGVPRRLTAKGFHALSLESVLEMGRELYANEPLLHHVKPQTARRLARLISAKAPIINAAQFIAPRAGCSPDEVETRLQETSLQVMIGLFDRQEAGELDTLSTDRQVWRRLAA
jgi:hypothetical protein